MIWPLVVVPVPCVEDGYPMFFTGAVLHGWKKYLA
jgi:hypothetical protein